MEDKYANQIREIANRLSTADKVPGGVVFDLNLKRQVRMYRLLEI